MKVLVVGRGGREHAICKKISESPLVETVYVAPGNDGMDDCAVLVAIEEANHADLVKFAVDQQINLVIIGPESPLLEGLADQIRQENIAVFGPSKKAAEIEGSKSFAKDLMAKYQIPTAAYQTFTDFEKAKEYVIENGAPIVIKADGLAAGKGVVVALTIDEAIETLQEMLVDSKFGAASSKVVIEEFLAGEEFSLMTLVNGDLIVPLEIAQDHKRAFDGDKGPNTGGMGAYSPVPQIGPETVEEALEKIVRPVARALIQEGRSFTGVLYAGLIQTSVGPKVIEFNARFGDPETQVVLPRMESDFVEVLVQLLNGRTPEVKWSSDTILGIVLASKGYPGDYQNGAVLEGLESLSDDITIFHSGTRRSQSGHFVTNGGRVLLASAKASSLLEAQSKVYGELKKIGTDGVFYRKDIGYRGLVVKQM